MKAIPTRIHTVSRAMHVLAFVGEVRTGPTATEIARKLSVPLPTIYHLLSTLVDEGALAKHDRRYHLGPQIHALAGALERRDSPPAYLLPPLRQLADETEETVYLSAWQYGELVILASIEGGRALKVSGLNAGFSGHAHARASGKLLLAALPSEALAGYLRTHPLEACTVHTLTDESRLLPELERIRENGYAIDQDELMVGISCVSGPVVRGGMTIAAITLSAPSARFAENAHFYVERTLIASRAASGPGDQ